MTIGEVAGKYGITQDALRYYERVGAIPPVCRTSGGIRNYLNEDIKWINRAVCLRNAGVSVETIAEFVKRYQEGDDTFEARLQLLKCELKNLNDQKEKLEREITLLNYKVSCYEDAVKTGVLVWK